MATKCIYRAKQIRLKLRVSISSVKECFDIKVLHIFLNTSDNCA